MKLMLNFKVPHLGNQYLPSAGKTECACLAVMFPKQNLEIIGRFIDGEDGDTEKAIIKARLGKLWGCEYEVVISKTPGTKKWELQQ
ncbi:hypothetical protein SS50377_27164 [Spironucleus salmonicida]|uniref:Uncharacterized protein n=2 Tax=Spironucleus salmonicida TaxID=348837 RepID=A0A9P8LMS7_9EUKA|nr:hypothetical protein SS50377_27164 [Spironucleus salmonicida]